MLLLVAMAATENVRLLVDANTGCMNFEEIIFVSAVAVAEFELELN